jgi:hypothetical protein
VRRRRHRETAEVARQIKFDYDGSAHAETSKAVYRDGNAMPLRRDMNRAASYACTARLSNFHHEIRRIFRMPQLWRVNLGGRRQACLLFDVASVSSNIGTL